MQRKQRDQSTQGGESAFNTSSRRAGEDNPKTWFCLSAACHLKVVSLEEHEGR
eukprot:m.15528 g.15528  ORF g.15528 m.15528 type:complete len:53 (-) comp7868_c0_seq1:479-637(-)